MTRALLLAALAVSACADVPTGPDRSNPFDPAFQGSRTVSTPGTPQLAPTSGLQLALTWADSSSFETGYRIERAQVGPFGFDSQFQTVGVTDADVTTFSQPEPVTAEGYLYRVVGLAGGRDRESAPSPPVRVRVLATISRSFDIETTRTISEDGLTLYGILSGGSTSLLAINVVNGRRRWEVPGPTALLRQVPDGRLVAVSQNALAGLSRIQVVSPEGAVLQTVALRESGDCQISGVDDAVSRVLGTCRVDFSETEPAVWTLADGLKTSLSELRGWRGAGLSPDGEVAIVQGNRETRAVRIAGQRVLWTVPGESTPRFSADGSLVSLPYGDYDDRLFRTATGEPVPARRGATLDESGRYLYTTQANEASSLLVTTFRPGDPAPIRSFLLSNTSYSAPIVMVLPDGGLAAVYGSTVVRWGSGRQWEVVE